MLRLENRREVHQPRRQCLGRAQKNRVKVQYDIRKHVPQRARLQQQRGFDGEERL